MTQDDATSNAGSGAVVDWSKESDATLLKTVAGVFVVAVAVCAVIRSATEKLTGPFGDFIAKMGEFAEPMARLGIDWQRCEIIEQAG